MRLALCLLLAAAASHMFSVADSTASMTLALLFLAVPGDGARFVVTFPNATARIDAYVPAMSIVKAYGRRLVLSVENETLDSMRLV